LFVLLFSTATDRNIFRFDKYLTCYARGAGRKAGYVTFRVKCPSLLLDFDQNSYVSKIFSETHQALI